MIVARAVVAAVTILVVGAVLAGCGVSRTGGATGGGRTPANRSGLAVAGYVVPWDPRSRVGAGDGVLSEVSPVWYQPDDDGGVSFASAEARASVANTSADAAARGVALAPTISNFRHGTWDGALIARLVGDPARRDAHVSAIVGLVRSGHWPAVDIDYESLPASSRGAFSAFVSELAGALHRLPARLSVTLHAKTSEPGDWPGAQAQDWRAIGAAADEVRVMAYDYSYSTSRPGPIAPPAWVDRVVALATRLVPRDRIELGLPTYGYDWAAGAPGVPLQWADVMGLATRYGSVPQWDAGSSSSWMRYTDAAGRVHTVWYEDARSLNSKIELARRAGVSRVVLWHLGGEDPRIWTTLRTAR